MRLLALAGVTIVAIAMVACSDGSAVDKDAPTCADAVSTYLRHTQRMQEELDPANDPGTEKIESEARKADELRADAVSSCGGEAAFLTELGEQRAVPAD